MRRLERVIERAVGVAWCTGFPILCMQVLHVRGRTDVLSQIDAALDDDEGMHRMRWRSMRELDLEPIGFWLDDSAQLGYVGAMCHQLDEALAHIDERGFIGDACVAAALADRSLVPTLADRFPSIDQALADELAAQTFRYGNPHWASHIGAALTFPLSDTALDGLIDSMHASAAAFAREYVQAILEPPAFDADDAAKRIAHLTDLVRTRNKGSDRMNAMLRMSRAFSTIAADGGAAMLHAALPAFVEKLGPVERWGPHAFGALCALDRPVDALRARGDRSLDREHHVELAETYARLGDRAALRDTLTAALRDAKLVTTSLPSALFGKWCDADLALTPQYVIRLARLTSDAGRARRLESALSAFC